MLSLFKSWRTHILLSIILPIAIGCSPSALAPLTSVQVGDRGVKLTILHTNDHHGHFWTSPQGEWGGLAARATLVERLRGEIAGAGGHTLLLDGGDVNSGTVESDMARAEPDFLGMKKLGYDAMAVGNHEFDNDLGTLFKQRDWAEFPFLSANIYYKSTQQRTFQPYILREINGVRIAIFGLTTDETIVKSGKFPSNKLEIRSPIEEARKLVPELRSQADLLIALTHMGHYPNGQHGSAAPGDVEMARAVPGIDVIVGGHSQLPLFEPDIQNGTYIVQAYEWGKYLGRMDLVLERGLKPRIANYELIPVNLRNPDPRAARAEAIPEDSEMRAFLEPWYQRVETLKSEYVGESKAAFAGDRAIVRSRQAPLGNLVGYVMKTYTGADAAILAGGNLRAGLPAGRITFGDVLSVHPWRGQYGQYRFTGRELRVYLEAVAQKSPGDGAFPQTYGVKIRTVKGKLSSAAIMGKDGTFENVVDERSYVIALPEFLAGGGDSYPNVLDKKVLNTPNLVDADVLRDFLSKRGVVDPQDFSETDAIIRE